MSPIRVSWGPKSATALVLSHEESFQVGIFLITYDIPKPLTHEPARKISLLAISENNIILFVCPPKF